MSCYTCGCSPCNCSQPANCQQCECPDPGSISAGRHLPVLDYKLCDKRLQNVTGFLVCNVNSSGTASIQFTPSPCVQIPELVVDNGVRFENIVSNMGDAGCFKRITPDDDAEGFLKASNGQFFITELPDTNVPDPLTLQNLFVTTLGTFKDISITGGLCFTNAATGTIVTAVGLDADGCLVSQTSGTVTPTGVSMALFYENAIENASATPNYGIANGGYAIIGNQISNADSIAAITDQFTIRVATAGRYFLLWAASMNRTGGAIVAKEVNLSLEINGGTEIPGEGFQTVNATQSATLLGFTLRTFAANDTVKIKYSTQLVTTLNNLEKVKLLLVRYGS